LTFFPSILCAEWDPEQLPNISKQELNVLNNQKFNKLKNKVLKYTENSWCSSEKTKLIFELILLKHPKICVEIGTFSGSSALPILAGLKYLNKGSVYLIDPWSNQEAVKGLEPDDPNAVW